MLWLDVVLKAAVSMGRNMTTYYFCLDISSVMLMSRMMVCISCLFAVGLPSVFSVSFYLNMFIDSLSDFYS